MSGERQINPRVWIFIPEFSTIEFIPLTPEYENMNGMNELANV